jgi:transposase
MPVRPFTREQAWLLPPSLDDLLPADHPARFVAAVVEALDAPTWQALGVDPDGRLRGAPGYAPRALLAIWLYGFMTGVRTTRRLASACTEQVPLLWLSGGQRPDHNTLWRFYQAHRAGLRTLFVRTVRTAVKLDLLDLALQAVDGTKLRGNVARETLRTAAGLRALLAAVDQAIADLESQHRGEGPPPARLTEALAQAQTRRQQIQAALTEVLAEEGPKRASPTDPAARLQKLRGGGYAAGYNGQAAAAGLTDPVTGQTGRLLTGDGLTGAPHDHEQLEPMLATIEAVTGQPVPTVLADSGYHSGATLERLEGSPTTALMPEPQSTAAGQPYHKDAFTYDPETDTCTCPEGRTLVFAGLIRRPGTEPEARRYRAPRQACAACPARALCTRSQAKGRSIGLRPDDARLKAHRARMATESARATYRRRKALIEPVFGVLKERLDGRRLWLRGPAAVMAAWRCLLLAFNLRALCRLWRASEAPRRAQLVGAA